MATSFDAGLAAMTFGGRALLALVCLLGLTAPARADPAAEARQRFEVGVRLFRERRYADARHAFEEANRIMPNGRVLANIAACLSGEGRSAQAVAMYRRFLTEGADGLPARARDDARREIARLRSSIADVAIAVEPAGAEVRVDGRMVGVAPLAWPIAVTPGQSTVEVRSPGYAPVARTIDTERAGTVSLSIVLLPVPTAGPEPTPPPPPPEVTEPAPVPREIDAFAPPPAPRPAPSTPIGRGPLFWTGVGLTGALAIGATVTGLLTSSQKDEYEDPSTSPARRRDLYDSEPLLATTTDILIDAAIVTAIATTLLFVLGGPDGDQAQEPARAPALSIGGAPCCRLAGSF